MVMWLIDHGHSEDNDACTCAAENAHIEILKLLADNGCPFDDGTFAKAEEGGHLEVLKLLHDQECPRYICQGRDASEP